VSETTSGDKALRLAMQMEEIGRIFYEAFAEGCGKADMADLARRLAGQEQDHYRTFRRMREALAGGGRPAPGGAEAAAEEELLRKHVVPEPAEVRRVALAGNAADALDLAVRMEEDSVRFYSALRADAAPADAEAIDRIIDAEKGHLAALRRLRDAGA